MDVGPSVPTAEVAVTEGNDGSSFLASLAAGRDDADNTGSAVSEDDLEDTLDCVVLRHSALHEREEPIFAGVLFARVALVFPSESEVCDALTTHSVLFVIAR